MELTDKIKISKDREFRDFRKEIQKSIQESYVNLNVQYGRIDCCKIPEILEKNKDFQTFIKTHGPDKSYYVATSEEVIVVSRNKENRLDFEVYSIR